MPFCIARETSRIPRQSLESDGSVLLPSLFSTVFNSSNQLKVHTYELVRDLPAVSISVRG